MKRDSFEIRYVCHSFHCEFVCKTIVVADQESLPLARWLGKVVSGRADSCVGLSSALETRELHPELW